MRIGWPVSYLSCQPVRQMPSFPISSGQTILFVSLQAFAACPADPCRGQYLLQRLHVAQQLAQAWMKGSSLSLLCGLVQLPPAHVNNDWSCGGRLTHDMFSVNQSTENIQSFFSFPQHFSSQNSQILYVLFPFIRRKTAAVSLTLENWFGQLVTGVH